MKFDECVNKAKSMDGIDKDSAYGKQCLDLWNYFLYTSFRFAKW